MIRPVIALESKIEVAQSSLIASPSSVHRRMSTMLKYRCVRKLFDVRVCTLAVIRSRAGEQYSVHGWKNHM